MGSRAAKAKEVRKARRNEIVTAMMQGMELLGEVITWNPKSENVHKHKDVIKALDDNGLDQKVARELLPRHAFNRACKKLSEEAIIDVIKENADHVRFQFTKKLMANEEWKYTKETEITLNKETGELTCPRQSLRDTAQRLLDEAMENRTSGDISRIVQKLFEKNGDFFPIRDQGGVYFVPQQHVAFTDQVHNFLKDLGGDLIRFPVPAGTQHGDKAVQESVGDAIQHIINEHLEAIDQFTINTRKDTMDNMTNRIKKTRFKIEAYANYLKDKSEELLKEIENANAVLVQRIDKLAKEKEDNPEGPIGLFGHSMTAVLRWMGMNGWTFAQARKVFDKKKIQCSNSTIHVQLNHGKKGEMKPADLDKKQIKELEALKVA